MMEVVIESFICEEKKFKFYMTKVKEGSLRNLFFLCDKGYILLKNYAKVPHCSTRSKENAVE